MAVAVFEAVAATAAAPVVVGVTRTAAVGTSDGASHAVDNGRRRSSNLSRSMGPSTVERS